MSTLDEEEVGRDADTLRSGSAEDTERVELVVAFSVVSSSSSSGESRPLTGSAEAG